MSNTIFQKVLSAFVRWNDHRNAMRELSAMPDYLLTDIGVSRLEIREVVNGLTSNASAEATTSPAAGHRAPPSGQVAFSGV